MKKTTKQNLTFRVSELTRKQLLKLAKASGESLSVVIRKAIAEAAAKIKE